MDRLPDNSSREMMQIALGKVIEEPCDESVAAVIGMLHHTRTELQTGVTAARAPKLKLHIHLDLDVLDPDEFPHVSVPSKVPDRPGLSKQQLQSMLRQIQHLASEGGQVQLVGFTMTEFRPRTQVPQELNGLEQFLEGLLGP